MLRGNNPEAFLIIKLGLKLDPLKAWIMADSVLVDNFKRAFFIDGNALLQSRTSRSIRRSWTDSLSTAAVDRNRRNRPDEEFSRQ